MVEKVLDVGYVGQRINCCAHASLAMVMNYNGVKISQDEIIERLGVGYFGISVGEMAKFSREKGFDVAVSCNGLSKIIGSIDDDFPVIVAQQNSIVDKGVHYRVVVGYDDVKNKTVVHDPRDDGNFLYVSNNMFMSLWHSQGFDCVALMLKGKSF